MSISLDSDLIRESTRAPLDTSDDFGIDWDGPIPDYVNKINVPTKLNLPLDEVSRCINIAFDGDIKNLQDDVDGVFIWLKLVKKLKDTFEVTY
eukprot:814579_1